jgi:hypothetical protein
VGCGFAGFGKTKLIVDLALIKGEFVIHLDVLKLSEILRKVYSIAASSSSCADRLLGNFLTKLAYCSYLILNHSLVNSPEEFYEFWEAQPQETFLWIYSGELPKNYEQTFGPLRNLIFAFDECQYLLGSIDSATADVKSPETLGSTQKSLIESLMHVARFQIVEYRFVFCATSWRVLRFPQPLCDVRKNLRQVLTPPLFTESVSKKYLLLNGIGERVAEIASPLLAGRAIASRYFLEVYQSEANDLERNLEDSGVELLVSTLVQRVLTKLKDFFLEYIRSTSLSIGEFLDFTVTIRDSKTTRRQVLIDLLDGEQIPIHPISSDLTLVLESISSIFVPLEEYFDQVSCKTNHHLAIQALKEILLDNQEASPDSNMDLS